VFYPLGGGQAGDAGQLILADGSRIEIADTRKSKEHPGRCCTCPPQAVALVPLAPGTALTAQIDWRAAPAHALSYRDPPAVCAGAAPGRRLLDHAPTMRGWTST
jgi:misacylated tRNA(Ala) deacylase